MMLKVILYAYMNNIYSCRKIEKLLHRDIHYILGVEMASGELLSRNLVFLFLSGKSFMPDSIETVFAF